MRPDDNVQELMKVSVKATQITKDVILKALKWMVASSQDPEFFKRHGGKLKYEDLNNMGKTELLAADINAQELKVFEKEFKKYHVNFAVDKNFKISDHLEDDEKTFTLYFLSKDSNRIEKAMQKVVEKMDKEKSHNLEKSGLDSVKEKQEEIRKAHRQKEKSREMEREI